MNRTARFNSIECTQNNKSFYISILPSDVLKNICFVSRREENSEKGFQRSLNETRAKDIAKYLDDFKGVIPSAIILSAQDNSKFLFDKEKNEAVFVIAPSSFMVLDGQHRLYGLFKAKNLYNIPVIIFNKLNTADEVKLFIDINTTQKGVPSTLLLDIKNLTGRETKKEDKQRQLFDKLNSNSVLAGYLSASKSKTGFITRVSFNSATNEIFESGFFQDKDVETIYKGLKNYLQASEKVLKKSKSEKAKLTNATFFKALFSIFNEVIDKSLKDYGDLKPESLENVLEPISKLSYDNYTGTSNATLTRIVSDMRKELNEYERRYINMPNSDIF